MPLSQNTGGMCLCSSTALPCLTELHNVKRCWLLATANEGVICTTYDVIGPVIGLQRWPRCGCGPQVRRARLPAHPFGPPAVQPQTPWPAAAPPAGRAVPPAQQHLSAALPPPPPPPSTARCDARPAEIHHRLIKLVIGQNVFPLRASSIPGTTDDFLCILSTDESDFVSVLISHCLASAVSSLTNLAKVRELRVVLGKQEVKKSGN